MADASSCPATPWREPLARARHTQERAGLEYYIQLATIRPDGTPANRTVVFRGFLERPDRLLCASDARGDKVGQLHRNPAVELCWYFPRSREQFRLRGTATLIEAGDPGGPREELAVFDIPAPAKASPPAEFCLIVMEPEQVDHLALRPFPHKRDVYERDGAGKWFVTAVNP
jgi:hypothetical protein